MAIATYTIANSIEWAKRLSFNRNPVIGNSLEPALSSAAMVMQTILGPPFDWWWNNEEVVFTCNPTPAVATSTHVTVVGTTLTVTAVNTFSAGDLVIGSGYTFTSLNGLLLEVATASSSQWTATVSLGAHNAADTGKSTNITTQDYTVSLPNFSHIEHASILDLDSTGAPVKWYELTVKNNLSLETSANRPEFIGPHVEDSLGNVTFRLFSAPDKAYPVEIHVIQSAPAVTSINQTWAPIPDFMMYIYNWGFLALMWQFADDPRSMYASQKFTAGILSRAEGLTEEERNIFLNNWDELMGSQLMKKQQGTQARSI